MSSKIGIVIPTYNERENIPVLIPKIFEVCRRSGIKADVLIVDDNSPDGTAEAAEKLGRKFDVRVLVRKRKLGIGSAYKEGFKNFMGSKVGILVQMDADLSHDPKYIPVMVKKINRGCDVVIGSRYVDGGKVKDWGILRKLISSTQNFLVRRFVKIPVSDMTGGYRAYRADVIRSINMRNIKSAGFSFQVELLYNIGSENFRICEIPIEFSDRRFGKSKLSIKEIFDSLKTLARLKMK